nr:MAG TPA: hypothetical protein [Caudoviricetes sp.]
MEFQRALQSCEREPCKQEKQNGCPFLYQKIDGIPGSKSSCYS